MYLVGAPHPNRNMLVEFLRSRLDDHYVTSAEVYQEILHRYASINRRAAVEDAFKLLDDLVVSVFPITRADVDAAKEIAGEHPVLSARDCLHLAVMQEERIHRILTFDRGFSAFPHITLLP